MSKSRNREQRRRIKKMGLPVDSKDLTEKQKAALREAFPEAFLPEAFPEEFVTFRERWTKFQELGKAFEEANLDDSQEVDNQAVKACAREFIEYKQNFRVWMIERGVSEDGVSQILGPIHQQANEAMWYAKKNLPNVSEMLAAEGKILKHGKNSEGKEIVWVEEAPVRPPARHRGWEEVVDIQDEMIRFWMSKFGRAYGNAWGRGIVREAIMDNKDNPIPGWNPNGMGWAHNLGYILQIMMQRADPMWVNNEVMDLIEASMGEWKPEPLIKEDVFPTFNGFALLPRPYHVTDVHGKQLAFRAIAWEALGPHGEIPDLDSRIDPRDSSGVMIIGYTHRDDPDDYPIMGNLEAESNQLKVPITVKPTMSICYVTPWSYKEETLPRELNISNGNAPRDVTGSGLEQFCTFTQIMWRLAKQTITSTAKATLPRAPRKRAERSGLMSDVLVVKLRQAKKPKDADHEPSSIEYDHRWRVRAHPRNQWYPSLQMHRQIIVPSHIKGPEDKPLLVKPFRAYEFTR